MMPIITLPNSKDHELDYLCECNVSMAPMESEVTEYTPLEFLHELDEERIPFRLSRKVGIDAILTSFSLIYVIRCQFAQLRT